MTLKGIAVRGPAPLFTGLLVQDSFSVALRMLLLGFLLVFTLMTRISGVPRPSRPPSST